MLAAAGIDPRDLGRTFNRAGTGTLNPDDVDRIVIPDTAEALEDMLRDGPVMKLTTRGNEWRPSAPFARSGASASS